MMKVQVPMWSTASDAELQFYREMGVEYISVMFHENDWDYERVSRLQERMADMQASLERLNDKIDRYEQGLMTAEKQLQRMREEKENSDSLPAAKKPAV